MIQRIFAITKTPHITLCSGFILFIFLFSTTKIYAQSQVMKDSLSKQISIAKTDTAKAMLYGKLAFEYSDNAVKMQEYAVKGLELAQQHHFTKGIMQNKRVFVKVLQVEKKYDDALKLNDSLLKIATQAKDDYIIAKCYLDGASVYGDKPDMDKTMEYTLAALKIGEEHNYKQILCIAYIKLAYIYTEKTNKKKDVLDYYQKALALAIELKDWENEMRCVHALSHLIARYPEHEHSSTGAMFVTEEGAELENYDEVMKYAQRAQQIAHKYQHDNEHEYIKCLADFNNQTGNYEKALKLLESEKEWFVKKNNKDQLSYFYGMLAFTKTKLKRTDDAIDDYYTAVEYAEKGEDHRHLAGLYYELASSYNIKNNYAKAYEYILLYDNERELAKRDDDNKSIFNLMAQYNNEKRENEITLLSKDKAIQALKFEAQEGVLMKSHVENLKQDAKISLLNHQKDSANIEKQKKDAELKLSAEKIKTQQNEIKQKNTIGIAVTIGLFMALLAVFFVFKGYKQKKKSNEIITLQNKELEKLSIVASKSENSIVICNTDSELIWANDAFTNTFGYTLEEYKKENGKTLLEISTNPEIKKLLNEAIEKKVSVSYESKTQTKYKGVRWFQTTISPVCDNLGNLQNIVFIDSDVTEITKQKEELEEKSKALRESHHNITLLSEIGQKITSTLDLEKILDTVYENVNDFMDATECGIGIYNEKEQVIFYPYQYYQSKRIENIENVSMRDDNRLSVWCVKNKKEVFINDMDQEHNKYISTLDAYGTNTPGESSGFLLQSLICLPLIIEKEVIGIIYVQSPKKNAYSPIQLEMFRTLASYTAVAMNNSEAYKKLSAAMREVEKLSIVASKSENSIAICNTDTELIWVNDAFINTFGYTTLEEFKKERGKTVLEISSNPNIKKVIEECIRQKVGIGYESKNSTKHKGTRWFQTTMSPVFDETGKLQNIVFIDSDITELKNTQTQLIQSEKMASLGQLTAGVAHEINNPINFVSAGIDSIKQNYNDLKILLDAYENLSKNRVVSDNLLQIENLKNKLDYKSLMIEMDHLIKSVKNGAMRTTEIIKSLRNFSRLDEYALKKADIQEGIDSTLTILTNKFKNRIEVVKDYDKIPSFNCFPGQLNQVFMNILSNAIDAIEGSGTILIKTKIAGNNAEVRIKDSGKGMTEEVKRKIFEPFFTTKNVGDGTGLGLSISYGIIEKHKGAIFVKSEQGKGTEFTIQIPMNLS